MITPASEYKLFFDEKLHKYYDELNNPLTSVTTVIGKYEYETDWHQVARNCWKSGIRTQNKYTGKSVAQIEAEWKANSDRALAQGNEKHNYLETSVKDSSNFYKFHSRHPGNNRRLYTIPEIISNPGYGKLSIDDFIVSGIRDRYPEIFYVIQTLVKAGYRIYAEIGTYNIDLLITGLIDILLIKGKSFIIIDWKTNEAPIIFDSGYFEKDENNKRTDRWIAQDHKMKFPLTHLASSIGNKYALQLGTYAWLVIQFGLKLEGLILCQIVQLDNGKEVCNIQPYPILTKDAETMMRHHRSKQVINVQRSISIF
jgi:hypothetical protein